MQAQLARKAVASLQALKQRAHQLLESQRSLQHQIQGLVAEQLGIESERDQLATKLEELSSELDSLQVERDSLTAHLQVLTAERDNIQQQWETLQTTVEDLEHQLTAESAQTAEQSKQREALQMQVEELQNNAIAVLQYSCLGLSTFLALPEESRQIDPLHLIIPVEYSWLTEYSLTRHLLVSFSIPALSGDAFLGARLIAPSTVDLSGIFNLDTTRSCASISSQERAMHQAFLVTIRIASLLSAAQRDQVFESSSSHYFAAPVIEASFLVMLH